MICLLAAAKNFNQLFLENALIKICISYSKRVGMVSEKPGAATLKRQITTINNKLQCLETVYVAPSQLYRLIRMAL